MQELNIEELAKKAIDEINGELSKQGLADIAKNSEVSSEEPFVIDMQDSYDEKEKNSSLSSLEQALSAVDEVLNKQEQKEIKEEIKESKKPKIPKESVKEETKTKNPIEKTKQEAIKTQTKTEEKKIQIHVDKESSEPIIIKEELIIKKQSHKDDVFLENIRERILVLFEGLSSSPKDEQRYELTINFLEFLLAKIEDKLKK